MISFLPVKKKVNAFSTLNSDLRENAFLPDLSLCKYHVFVKRFLPVKKMIQGNWWLDKENDEWK